MPHESDVGIGDETGIVGKEGVEILYGVDDTTKAIVKFIDKTKHRYNVYAEHSKANNWRIRSRVDMKTIRSPSSLNTSKCLRSSVISVIWCLIVALRERNMSMTGIHVV